MTEQIMLSIGTKIRVKAFDLDYQGRGVVSYLDKIIFVPHFLVDEEAIIEITKIKKNFYEGKVIELLSKSLDRVDSHDAMFGACDLIHLSKKAQLNWVAATTKKTIQKVSGLTPKIHDVVYDTKDTHYRNKSVFHIMDYSILSFGLFHVSNQKLIQTKSFILSDQLTNHIILTLTNANITIDPKVFKHLIVRTNQKNEALVTIVADKKEFKGFVKVLAVLKTIHEIKGITLNIQDNDYEILGSDSTVRYGENLIVETLGDINLYIDDRSFFQINYAMMIKTYALILSHILYQTSAIDAYSGVGSIGFYLKDHFKTIYMIESNVRNVEMANLTKKNFLINHVEIILGKAEEKIKDYPADVLIVDPPRSGLSSLLIDSILSNEFKQIIYLSCDVKTLSRDLKILSSAFKITDVYPLRMFPNTTELETLVILKNKLLGDT
jgi:23S rRNA (uracil1939-C5)-methyltransferase